MFCDACLAFYKILLQVFDKLYIKLRHITYSDETEVDVLDDNGNQ